MTATPQTPHPNNPDAPVDGALFVLDRRGAITSWNEATGRASGCADDELYGAPFDAGRGPEAPYPRQRPAGRRAGCTADPTAARLRATPALDAGGSQHQRSGRGVRGGIAPRRPGAGRDRRGAVASAPCRQTQ